MRCVTTGFLVMVAFVRPAGAEPVHATYTVDDLKALQGRWKVTGIFWPSGDERRLPKEARLNEEGTVLVVEGNRITHDGKAVATLANDLALAAQQKEVGFAGNRLLMLTLTIGEGSCAATTSKATRFRLPTPIPARATGGRDKWSTWSDSGVDLASAGPSAAADGARDDFR